jgi:hypothetical protein
MDVFKLVRWWWGLKVLGLRDLTQMLREENFSLVLWGGRDKETLGGLQHDTKAPWPIYLMSFGFGWSVSQILINQTIDIAAR